MASLPMSKCLLLVLSLAVIALEAQAQARNAVRRNRNRNRNRNDNAPQAAGEDFGCVDSSKSDVNKNITALWSHMKFLSQPIEVHVHSDERKCDDYFGCAFSDHSGHSHRDHHGHSHGHDNNSHGHGHHSHGHHSHGHHSHGHHSHAHGSHAHGSHAHGSYAHGSHGHHGGMKSAFKDNHIHIHLSVNNKDDCKFVSYAPKDEFVYARCDMQPVKRRNAIEGSIFMRQKPHGILETKIKLGGFPRASEGIKDGKHDYFFDLHEKADFSDKCASFGGHDHVHHNDGSFDHDHSHQHEHDAHGHNHDHEDGHDHSVHDHHAHADDWGNIIVNDNKVADMEVNCTHHELYGPKSMFGRGIVLHDKDDKAVSCCAITYANIDDDSWETL